MRRLGIAIVVLIVGLWGLWYSLDGARTAEAPQAERTPQVDAQGEASALVEVAQEVPPRSTAAHPEDVAEASTQVPSDAEELAWFRGAVRVLDVEGAPIEGARVWVPRFAAVPEQVTDAEGRCTLQGGDVQLMMVEFAAVAEGYFTGGGMLLGEPEHVVRLHESGFASGRVLDAATRAPVAAARVATRPTGKSDVDGAVVHTDAAGMFEALAVPHGQTFLVDVSARGYVHTGVRAMSIAGEPEDPASALELLLEPARTGYLQVVDSEHGRPIQGATVSGRGQALETDVDGRADLDSTLRPEDLRHSLEVRAEGHCATRFEVEGFGAPDEPIVLRLPPACRVEVSVRPVDGEELPPFRFNAQVGPELARELRDGGPMPDGPDAAHWPENARWIESSLLGADDPDRPGRYVIDGVPPGLPVLNLALYVDTGTLARRSIGPMGGPGSLLRIDWPLEPAGTARLEGRVLLDGEQRRAHLYVERDGLDRVTMTDDAGHYAFTDLRPGRYSLHCELRLDGVRLGGMGRQDLEVDVAADGISERDVHFEVPMGTIRGTLSGARSEPLGGVQVNATQRALDVKSWCITAADGTWSLDVPLLESPYAISCQRRIVEQDLEVLAGTEGVALHEAARGRLRFRVLDAATGEVIRTPILAVPRAGNLTQTIGGSSWPQMEPSGWCEKELLAGTVEFGVYTADGLHRSERRVVEVPVEGVVEAEFRLGPAVKLELRLDPEGGPLPENHVLALLPEAEWELATAQVGTGYPRVSFDALPFDPVRGRDLRLWPGRAHVVGGLAPGRYRFKIFPDDVAIEPEWVEVPAEGVVDVRWRAKP